MLRERIQYLIGVVKELNKLADQLIKFVWKITSLAGIIIFLLYSITK